MGKYLLGIDAGTSVTKAALFDLDGQMAAAAVRRVKLSRPQPTWSETDMEQAWRTTIQVIRSTLRKGTVAPNEILGVGVTGAMVGAWIIDQRGRPARPAILWDDCRAQPWIEEQINKDPLFMSRIFNSSGSVMQQGCTLPVIRWLFDHEPDVMTAATSVLGCKDWLRYRLTGTINGDPTEASVAPGDTRSRGRSETMLALFGLDRKHHLFPDLSPSESIAGKVSDGAASETGLRPGTPVAIGAGDVPCSILGAGSFDTGTACTVLGTTCLNCLTIDQPTFTPADTGLLFTLPGGKWLRAMVNIAGTTNLDWFVEEMLPDLDSGRAGARNRFTRIEALARDSEAGARGVIYHPYLGDAGIIAPIVSARARGQFTGLAPAHGRADLLRAIYEGLCYAVRDCYEAMAQDFNDIRLVGGGANSGFWCQMLADITERRAVVPDGEEFGAKGAALLAGVAIGAYGSVGEAVTRASRPARTYTPDPDLSRAYEKTFNRYQAIRQAMTSVW